MTKRKVDPDALLSKCELANALGRSESYVKCMMKRGFRMIGGRATLNQALAFLEICPQPCRKAPTLVPVSDTARH